MKKEHKRKNYKYQLKKRNEAKYKMLPKMTNIFQTQKLFKMHKEKWSYLLYIQSMLPSRKLFVYKGSSSIFPKVTLRVRRFCSSKYRELIKAKRKFQYYYGVKCFSFLKRYYHKTTFLYFDMYYLFLKKTLNLFASFENRVDVILVRSYFFPNLYICRDFIKAGHVTVNNNIVTNINTITKLYDIIRIRTYRHIVLNNIISSYIDQKFKFHRLISFLNYFHFEVNYNILTIFRSDVIINIKNLESFYPFAMKFNTVKAFVKMKS